MRCIFVQQGRQDVILIADIGGTNCRFELWKVDTRTAKPIEQILHVVRSLWPKRTTVGSRNFRGECLNRLMLSLHISC